MAAVMAFKELLALSGSVLRGRWFGAGGWIVIGDTLMSSVTVESK